MTTEETKFQPGKIIKRPVRTLGARGCGDQAGTELPAQWLWPR